MSNLPCAMPRASRLCVAVLAALSLPAFAEPTADPAAAPDAAPQATILDALQVRGERMDAIEAERALTPGGVSIVDGGTFYERSSSNLADALRYVPGLWIQSSTGGDAVVFSARGSNLDATDYDGNGIKLFHDGLPVTTADGNNHNSVIDPLATRYAIVARGANALTYGASTLGGAIDFVSPTARDGAPLQLSINGGGHGLLAGRLSGGIVSDRFDLQATMEAKDWDGYREHGGQQRAGLYANAGWKPADDIELRVYASHVDNDEQLAGGLTREQMEQDPGQANPSAITGDFQWNVAVDRLAAKGRWDIDADSRLEFGLSWEDQHLYHPIVDRVMVDFDGPGPMEPVEVFSLLKATDQRTRGGMLRYNVRAGDHDVLAGVNLADTREEGGNHRNAGGRMNGQWGAIDNRSDNVELFLVDRWKFAPDWTLVYGAQGVSTGRDVRSTDLDSGAVRNPKDDYSSFNPRLGVIRALGDRGELFASASRLFEAPTTFELEDDVRAGNATLDAMHGTVAEFGLRGEAADVADAARWHWDVSVYYAQIRDEIVSVDDPDAPGTSLSTNVDRTVHAGVEALLGASVALGDGTHRIEPRLSATWNAFSFDGNPVYGDNELPGAPDYVVRGEVMYRHAGGFFAGPTFDLVGARWADFANTYKVDAYALLGLRAGFAGDDWELFVEGRNLADKAHVGTLGVRDVAQADAAILQPGEPRSVYAGLRLRF